MQRLLIDVTWSPERVVHVSLRPIPLVRHDGGAASVGPAVAMGQEDVTSFATLQEFLRRVTRQAAAETTVHVVAFEPDVDALLDILQVEGPPPEVIAVALAAR